MPGDWSKFGGGRQLVYGVDDSGTAYPLKGSRMGESNYIAGDVFIQDQHTSPFLVPFHSVLQDGLAFGSAVSPGDWDITLSPGHGFTGAGEMLLIIEDTSLASIETVAVSGNVLTLDEQIGYPYTGSASIQRVDTMLNANGTATRKTFIAYPPPGVDHDITGFRLNMITQTEPDDSKFGDIAALTRGVNFNVRVAEGVPSSLDTFHTNGDFSRIAGDLEYSDKAGGGAFSVRVDAKLRLNWGVTIRARGAVADEAFTRDEIHLIVQDDLTGLNDLRANYYGHVVSP